MACYLFNLCVISRLLLITLTHRRAVCDYSHTTDVGWVCKQDCLTDVTDVAAVVAWRCRSGMSPLVITQQPPSGLWCSFTCTFLCTVASNEAAMAQEQEQVVCYSQGWRFNPCLLLVVCHSAFGQDAQPQAAPHIPKQRNSHSSLSNYYLYIIIISYMVFIDLSIIWNI